MQGTVDQSVLVQWFREESAGPGKACTFSGFDYRGFKSLLHTYPQGHTWAYELKYRYTLAPQRQRQGWTKGLQTGYRPFLHRNGGDAAKGQFLMLKIPTEKGKLAKLASLNLHYTIISGKKCNEKRRRKCNLKGFLLSLPTSTKRKAKFKVIQALSIPSMTFLLASELLHGFLLLTDVEKCNIFSEVKYHWRCE